MIHDKTIQLISNKETEFQFLTYHLKLFGTFFLKIILTLLIVS